MESNPMFAGRAEAILQELAMPTPATHADGREFTAEDASDYATSFIAAIGVPSDMAASTLGAIREVDFDEISTELGRMHPGPWVRAHFPNCHGHGSDARRVRCPPPGPPREKFALAVLGCAVVGRGCREVFWGLQAGRLLVFLVLVYLGSLPAKNLFTAYG
jgi:hypothetical protein